MADAILVLADGSVFRGRNFGARGTTFGEMCFNTGLTGYQEVLTDPSYHGQIVAMTYPHQGNYGLNNLDEEAPRPWVRGFVVREVTTQPSSWRSQESLPAYLERHNVVGIEGIDTRRLTRILRSQGAMTAGITTEDLDESSFLEQVRSAPVLEGRDLVAEVTPDAWFDADVDELRATGDFAAVSFEPDPRVDGAKIAALDLGMKKNILRCLVGMGARTRVYGGKSSSKDILDWAPDGVFVSNGPGDPSAVPYAAETIKEILRAGVPVFGICLGHQILGTALGGSTYKLKFGHRGGNHPVKSLSTGKVEITTQNHGFAVRAGRDPLAGDDAWRQIVHSTEGDWMWDSDFGKVALSHFDLNDGTLEGLRCLDVPAYSVQYHPEAAPGPHDSRYLFGDFAELISTTTGGARKRDAQRHEKGASR